MAITRNDVDRLTSGKTGVVGPDSQRIGDVAQIYTSDDTGEPTWATVRTGMFGSQESFVPLTDASMAGDNLQVAFDKETVRGAPRIEAEGHLSEEEEDQLYRHYGISDSEEPSAGEQTDRGDRRDASERADTDGTDQQRAGTDRTGTDRTDQDRTDQDRTDQDRTGTDWTDQDRADQDRTDQDRTDQDRADQDRAGTDRAGAAASGAAAGAAAGRMTERREPSEGERTDREGAAALRNQDESARRDRAESGRRHEPTGEAQRHIEAGAGGRSSETEGREGLRPGERTTRLRRYVVTERVVQTVEPMEEDRDR